MNTSKKTMLAAALAVAVVALAGVGYALAYTATTQNSGNALETTYVNLSQDSGSYNADILTSLYFDSENTAANTFTYTPVSTHTEADSVFTPISSGHVTTGYALISNPIVLSVDKSHSAATAGHLTVTSENFATGGLTITLVLGSVENDVITAVKAIGSTTGSWDLGQLTFSTGQSTSTNVYSWNVYLFASGDTSTAVANTSNSTFTFELEMTV